MSDAEAQGYLLLTLPDVRVSQVYGGSSHVLATGEMRLECVSLPADPVAGQRANPFADVSDPNKDLWLVLQIGTFELPLIPTQKITVLPPPSPPSAGRTFAPPVPPKAGSLTGNRLATPQSGMTFSIQSAEGNSGASILLALPPAEGPEDEEDIETFQVLLKQYGCLSLQGVTREVRSTAVIVDVASPAGPDLSSQALSKPSAPNPIAQAGSTLTPGTSSTTSSLAPPSRPGLTSRPSAGRFVLVDETSGKVIGELDQTLSAEKDAELAKTGDPVVVDFGELKEGWSSGVTVKTIDEKDMEGDWLLKGAHYLSKGILTFGASYKTGVTSAAEYYIKNVTPSVEPVKFHPAAKEGIRQVHNVSATGLKVTKKTLGAVHDVIGKAMVRTAEIGEKEYNNIKEEIGSPPPSRRGSTNALDSPRRNSASLFQDPAASRRAMLNAEAEQASRESPVVEEPAGYDLSNSAQAPGGQRRPPPPPPQRTGPPSSYTPPTNAKKEQAKGFFRKVLLAAEVVVTSVEATGAELINSTTNAASSAAGHKYGPEAAHATQLLGGSVRNVALVYVDVAGVGRKTLIGGAKKGAKGIIKTRLADGTEVTLAQPTEGGATQIQMADGQTVAEAQELVVAMGDVKLDDQGRAVDLAKKRA